MAKINNSEKEIKIGLVSFIEYPDWERTKMNTPLFKSIIEDNPDLHILAFPGRTLYDKTELKRTMRNIKNTKKLVLFEVIDDSVDSYAWKGYAIRNGKLIDRNIIQHFATKDIEQDPALMSKFLKDLKSKRSFSVRGKTVRWLICGELNMLRNEQSNNNKPLFRFKEDRELSKAYKSIFDDTDIFINPTHTAMGNQGKMHKRREALSKKKRIYCSTSNFDIGYYRKRYDVKGRPSKERLEHNLNQKSLQYCYYNGKPVEGTIVHSGSDYIFRKYIM